MEMEQDIEEKQDHSVDSSKDLGVWETLLMYGEDDAPQTLIDPLLPEIHPLDNVTTGSGLFDGAYGEDHSFQTLMEPLMPQIDNFNNSTIMGSGLLDGVYGGDQSPQTVMDSLMPQIDPLYYSIIDSDLFKAIGSYAEDYSPPTPMDTQLPQMHDTDNSSLASGILANNTSDGQDHSVQTLIETLFPEIYDSEYSAVDSGPPNNIIPETQMDSVSAPIHTSDNSLTGDYSPDSLMQHLSPQSMMTDEVPMSDSASTIPLTLETAKSAAELGIVPKIQNVLTTAHFNCQVDLKKIVQRALNAEYNPSVFRGIIMRINEPRTTALIFSSGKFVVTGAKNEDDARTACRKFTRIMQLIGFPAQFTQFKIKTMIACYNATFRIRLECIHLKYAEQCTYEPEVFPGLIYRFVKPPIQCIIFVSGKLLMLGGLTSSDISEAFEQIFSIIKKYRYK